MRARLRIAVLIVFTIFFIPLAIHAALSAFDGRPTSWRLADWSSAGTLPDADAFPQARVLVLSGQTGGWKGIFAVHTWIVLKRAHAHAWTRYDVVGWGSPVRINGWAPDGRWFGSTPTVVADVTGEEAERLIPKIEAAVRAYAFRRIGDYRIWPGPNSNTFVATVLRAVPEIGVALLPNALGKDFRPLPYVGPTDSHTGFEINLWGIAGLKVGWIEGIEINLLGLVVGIDIRQPALKLPGFGRLGFGGMSAAATPARR